MLAGLLLCVAIAPLLALVGLGYAALTLSYTLVWRHLIVFDIFAVAGGFVLRAVAGGVAAPVTLSRWFLLVVTSSAVFVAAAKRYAELQRTEGRTTIDEDGCSTLQLEGARADHRGRDRRGPARVLHVGVLIARRAGNPVAAVDDRAVRARACFATASSSIVEPGEAPEELLLSDRPLQLAGLAWLALFALEVHAAS